MKTKHFLLCCLAVLCSISTFAHDFEVDGIYYNKLGGDSVEVTEDYNYYSGSVIIPATVEYNNTTYRITAIGNDAFQECSSLTSIIWNAQNCTSAPFAGIASQITSFTFGDNVEYIPANLCSDMSNLTSVNLGNSVTKVGSSAFKNCTKLRQMKIGSGLEELGEYVLSGCTGLVSLTIGADFPPLAQSNTFQNVSTTLLITVPCGTADLYKAASYWNVFTNYQEKIAHAFSAVSQDEATGIVQIVQEPTCTQPAIIKALPMDGYTFQTWSDGNTQSMRQIHVNADIDLAALFVPTDGSGNVSDVTVVPTDSTAAFTWPAVEGAASYTLIVWADENETERICTLTFDAAGRLTNIDFSKHKAPAKNTAAGFGLNFTVTGLEAGTKYGYSLDSKTSEGVVLNSKNGTFETVGATGIEDIFTPAASDSARKVLINGTIYILRNGEKYTIDGQRIM